MNADQDHLSALKLSGGGAPPHPFDKRWFVHLSGKTYGPYSGHQIRQLVEKQRAAGSDLVYAEGGSAWTQLEDDPILRSLIESSNELARPSISVLKTAPRFRLTLLFGLPLLAALIWIAWPYYTAYELEIAVRNADVPTLESLVAWDSVREGLRNDLNASFLRSMNADAKKQSADFGTGLAVVLVPAMVDRIIASYVTPQAIATFSQNKVVASPTDNPGAPPKNYTEMIQAARQIHWDQIQYAFFTGAFAFRVDVVPKYDPPLRNPVTLLFNWAGNWRLTRVVLPADAMETLEAKNKGALAPAKRQTDSPQITAVSPPPNAPVTPSETIRPESPPLGITLLSKNFKNSNISAGDFESDITFQLSIKNVTDRDIRAFDGVITFTDLLDNEILSSKLAINEIVRAGGTLDWKGSIKYNQFMDAHQRLRNESQENLKIKFMPRKVLFTDGSSKDYSGH